MKWNSALLCGTAVFGCVSLIDLGAYVLVRDLLGSHSRWCILVPRESNPYQPAPRLDGSRCQRFWRRRDRAAQLGAALPEIFHRARFWVHARDGDRRDGAPEPEDLERASRTRTFPDSCRIFTRPLFRAYSCAAFSLR